jgi:hypothetical protein
LINSKSQEIRKNIKNIKRNEKRLISNG